MLGQGFLSRLKKADLINAKQRVAFERFNKTFPADVVKEWEKMVLDWDDWKEKKPGGRGEKDKDAPKNPYEEPNEGM